MRWLQTLGWWLRGERPLRAVAGGAVGSIVRPYGTATIYTITRLVLDGGQRTVWGRPTGLYESGAAAREYARAQLARLQQAGHLYSRSTAFRLLRQVQGRYGLSEASAAAAIAAALHEGVGSPP